MRRKFNQIPKLHIKKGDMVKVLSGDDKGQTGRVLEVYPKKRAALVEGVNIVTKHQKPNQENPNGARNQLEAPLPVSKLMLIDPKSGEPTRIGREKDGKTWVRIAKKTGNKID